MATENKNLSQYDKATIPNSKDFRFGIVVSEWNGNITENLYKVTIEALLDTRALEENIIRWNVRGSSESIYSSKKMIDTQRVDAVIAIGCVIQGESKHFDFVCEGVTERIKDLNIKYDIPVICCVLTANTIQQSI